ncbi:MAG: rRNA maturation RNase YbeY [Bacteroidota bacterium]
MPIRFFTEQIDFKLTKSGDISAWLSSIASIYKHEILDLNVIFTSDQHLLKVNQDFLNHDYYTDIITFDNSEESQKIEAEIYISIQRVEENATNFNVSFDQELSRVIAHGLLHLLGFQDHTAEDKRLMRQKEEQCLSLLSKDVSRETSTQTD